MHLATPLRNPKEIKRKLLAFGPESWPEHNAESRPGHGSTFHLYRQMGLV